MVYLLISFGPHVITHNISLYMLHIPKSYFIIHFPLHTYGIQYIPICFSRNARDDGLVLQRQKLNNQRPSAFWEKTLY